MDKDKRRAPAMGPTFDSRNDLSGNKGTKKIDYLQAPCPNCPGWDYCSGFDWCNCLTFSRVITAARRARI